MMTENTDSQPVPVGEDWFDTWVADGKVAQRSVDIYGRPDLFARYEHLQRRLETAETAAADEESMAGSEADQIAEEIAALYEEWLASKATWYMRALDSAEVEAIEKESDYPDALDEEKATDEEKKQHAKQQELAEAKSNRLVVCKSLVKVENPSDEIVRKSITPDVVETIEAKLGKQTILKLVAAAMVAMTQEPTISAPLPHTNSKSDQS